MIFLQKDDVLPASQKKMQPDSREQSGGRGADIKQTLKCENFGNDIYRVSYKTDVRIVSSAYFC